MRSSIVIVYVFVLLGCDVQKKHPSTLLNVREIANKGPEEVSSILGKPDSTYTINIMGKTIFCQSYEKHHVEIQYPEKLATDIVIYGPHGLPFDQTALQAFNLDYNIHHPGEYKKDQLIRWFNVDEFSTISFYNPEMDSMRNVTNFRIFFKAK